ncbi:uncharacterized protein LOC131215097 [Anopheles bellator]|uniref:uncharacterized protein LOC131215097 n=1 Tax=Anopheles bellator TaxID=139047 RepID=UPI002649D6F3|nr:uncharacterized protein LOC131215097 [Anopheles bellator]
MTTLLPTSQSTGVEAYEDMFKEITRKLYGEESAHGLYPHNTQVAQLAQLAPGGPIAPPEGGERSFTTLTQIGYGTTTTVGGGGGGGGGGSSGSAGVGHQHTAGGGGGSSQHQHHHHAPAGAGFKSEEHISNAFGLAALMQGGFPAPGTILNPVHFPGASKTPSNISTPSGEDRWNAQHVAQHTAADDAWSGAKPSASSGAQYRKSHKKAKSDRSDGAANGAVSGLNIPSTADRGKGSTAAAAAAAAGGGAVITKRYGCATCPYTTDRRDLFTRHENIHKEDKPFQCYACLKPFNRADHVKKHFLRMHRELEYDIAKTRRYPPSSSGGGSTGGGGASGANLGGSSGSKGGYYAATSTASQAGGTGGPASTGAASLAQMSLNIPSSSFSASGQMLAIPAHSLDHHQHSALALNGGHSSQLLHLQQHHNVQSSHPSSISIKQEKGGGCPPVNMSTGGSSGGALPDDKSFVKKVKGEKKFTCAFCPWAGADNWGLKRHLNTHTKPYVCLLCDYKAARSERLATHVFKVHNKKACAKCNFFAEDQLGLEAHLQEAHPHDPTKASGSKGPGSGSSSNGGSGSTGSHSAPSAHHHPPSANGNAVLRNLGNAFTSNNLPTNIPSTGNGFGNGTSNGHYHATNVHHAATGNVLTNSNAANLIDTINQHLAATGQQQHPGWIAKQTHRKRGPDLLYSYLEADGSDSGDYARLLHMQAVGRNKASVTQDFHNAGGGDNNGRKSAAPAANPLAFAGGDATSAGVKATDQDSGPASLSLASLLGGDQLSFLQLLATAAVAQQRLQLQSDQQQVANQKKQHHHHQSQPKPSTTSAEPIGSSGVPNGVRPYATMVSSPPATSTQHSTTSTTTTIPNTIISADSTNGTSQPLSFVANGHAIDASTPSVKRRRTNNVSSNDKENLMYRKNVTAPPGAVGVIVSSTTQTPNGTTIVALPASNGLVRNGAKIGHHNHHHHHHHNNNNSSTNNKNINDIFDKVYKKPQGAFAKQQQPTPAAAHSLPTILRTAPPSAVEEDGRAPARSASFEGNAPQCSPSEGEQFSLAEFLKNHTEVSISTVGGTITGDRAVAASNGEKATIVVTPSAGEAYPFDMKPQPGSPSALVDHYDSSSSCGSGTSGFSQKRKSESERNPRKQQQPRRIEESEPKPARPLLKVLSPMELDSKLEDEKLQHGLKEKQNVCEATIVQNGLEREKSVEVGGERGASESPNKLADIRDKHLIQLVTRRRCCRICQRRGQLEHLDNGHYHSKISLLLHTRWRHQGNCEGARRSTQCHQCGGQFSQRYKLILHQKLTGHKGGGWRKGQTKISRTQKADFTRLNNRPSSVGRMKASSTNGAGCAVPEMSVFDKKCSTRKLPKKQRKRKPRSRCFTRRRK